MANIYQPIVPGQPGWVTSGFTILNGFTGYTSLVFRKEGKSWQQKQYTFMI